MVIAVASDGLRVHSNRDICANYNYYRVRDGKIVDSQNLPHKGMITAHDARLFSDLGVNVVVFGNVSKHILDAFESQGITAIAGASGRAINMAQAYLDLELGISDRNPSAQVH